jgi:hypothetical protein
VLLVHHCWLCRQLINKVLVALRPSWLSEPQLAADVGGKLLVDLKHLLPPKPPAAAQPTPSTTTASIGQDMPEPAAAGSGAAAGLSAAAASVSAQLGDQQQQQVHKLLVLLGCLVAILKATSDTSGVQELVSGAVDFIEAAHSCMCAHATAAAAVGAQDSIWSSAATSLAGSMLALWEAVLGQGGSTAAAGEGSSSADGAVDQQAHVQQQGSAAAVKDEQAEGSASPAAAATPVADGASVMTRAWGIALATLQVPLLPAEDAVGLLGSISRALTTALSGIDKASSSSNHAAPTAGMGNTSQGVRPGMHLTAVVPAQLAADLWATTEGYR